jgi:hypothetical protein
MNAKPDRQELIQIIQRIMKGRGSEAEQDALIAKLNANVPDPNVLALIYYPPQGTNWTAEEVLDRALAYKVIVL